MVIFRTNLSVVKNAINAFLVVTKRGRTMRTALVTTTSMALTFMVVANAYYQKKQFYTSVIYVTKSSPSMAVSSKADTRRISFQFLLQRNANTVTRFC